MNLGRQVCVPGSPETLFVVTVVPCVQPAQFQWHTLRCSHGSPQGLASYPPRTYVSNGQRFESGASKKWHHNPRDRDHEPHVQGVRIGDHADRSVCQEGEVGRTSGTQREEERLLLPCKQRMPSTYKFSPCTRPVQAAAKSATIGSSSEG